MREWALVRGNVVENVIVVDDDDHGFAPDYVGRDDNDFERAVDLSTLEVQPSIGWVFRRGIGYVPPAVIAVDRDTIPANGTTAATVTYTDNRAAPADHVTFVVNGEEQDPPVPLVDGKASITVASSTAGDTVTVSAEGLGVSIEVEGP